jgi:hypothetical protein
LSLGPGVCEVAPIVVLVLLRCTRRIALWCRRGSGNRDITPTGIREIAPFVATVVFSTCFTTCGRTVATLRNALWLGRVNERSGVVDGSNVSFHESVKGGHRIRAAHQILLSAIAPPHATRHATPNVVHCRRRSRHIRCSSCIGEVPEIVIVARRWCCCSCLPDLRSHHSTGPHLRVTGHIRFPTPRHLAVLSDLRNTGAPKVPKRIIVYRGGLRKRLAAATNYAAASPPCHDSAIHVSASLLWLLLLLLLAGIVNGSNTRRKLNAGKLRRR